MTTEPRVRFSNVRTGLTGDPPLHRGKCASVLASFALCALLAALPSGATGGAKLEPQRLLTQYKCYICHADRETKAGPAYVDVAVHFRGHQDAVATIAREIRRGVRRGGPWHMPPHPEVSASEARAMARYIMSLQVQTKASRQP
jgi:cytochrome c